MTTYAMMAIGSKYHGPSPVLNLPFAFDFATNDATNGAPSITRFNLEKNQQEWAPFDFMQSFAGDRAEPQRGVPGVDFVRFLGKEIQKVRLAVKNQGTTVQSSLTSGEKCKNELLRELICDCQININCMFVYLKMYLKRADHERRDDARRATTKCRSAEVRIVVRRVIVNPVEDAA
jgi:hypothetical protein